MTKPEPLSADEFANAEDDVNYYLRMEAPGTLGALAKRLIATIKALQAAQSEDIVRKEVNRKTLADARKAEREECAKLVETYDFDLDGTPWSPEGVLAEVAEAIRSRQ